MAKQGLEKDITRAEARAAVDNAIRRLWIALYELAWFSAFDLEQSDAEVHWVIEQHPAVAQAIAHEAQNNHRRI